MRNDSACVRAPLEIHGASLYEATCTVVKGSLTLSLSLARRGRVGVTSPFTNVPPLTTIQFPELFCPRAYIRICAPASLNVTRQWIQLINVRAAAVAAGLL